MAMLAPFPILFLLLLSFYSGNFSVLAIQQKSWCVAKPATDDNALQAAIDYSCSHVNCSPIQAGGSCFNPNTKMHHASYAMNEYYQTMGRNKMNCNFSNSGLIAVSDPSYGGCSYNGQPADVDVLKKWCVAKPAAEENILQANIDFVCNHLNCELIKNGGACFNPNTIIHHASFAMNLYYQNNGQKDADCDFKKTGIIVTSDPSLGTGTSSACWKSTSPATPTGRVTNELTWGQIWGLIFRQIL